jgi:hypothetical protein
MRTAADSGSHCADEVPQIGRLMPISIAPCRRLIPKIHQEGSCGKSRLKGWSVPRRMSVPAMAMGLDQSASMVEVAAASIDRVLYLLTSGLKTKRAR